MRHWRIVDVIGLGQTPSPSGEPAGPRLPMVSITRADCNKKVKDGTAWTPPQGITYKERDADGDLVTREAVDVCCTNVSAEGSGKSFVAAHINCVRIIG